MVDRMVDVTLVLSIMLNIEHRLDYLCAYKAGDLGWFIKLFNILMQFHPFSSSQMFLNYAIYSR